MATLLTLLDDLRDRLNDAGDTQVTKANKIKYLNYGINQMFPYVYRVVRDTVTLATDTYEYQLPVTMVSDARIFRVEVETGVSTGKYVKVEDFEITPGSTRYISFPALPGRVGAKVRVSAAYRLAQLVNDNDVFGGWVGSEELPVLYAMGCVAGRRLDDRLDHRRLSTVASANGVGVETIEGNAQFWFAQFDVALERVGMPLPVA